MVEEVVDEVSDEVSDKVDKSLVYVASKRCIQAWRRHIALLSEHGVDEKTSKALGEVVVEEDGGCRVPGSCSVLSGMLLVLP